MDMNKNKKITGKSFSMNNFRLHETQTTLDISAVSAVLDGDLAAYRVQAYCPTDKCEKIVDNFWKSAKKVPRPGYGADGVEAYFVGASHIEKTTLEYLQAVSDSQKAVEELYEDAINPIANFREQLYQENKKITKARPAQFNDMPAGDSKAVYWNNIGDFLLEPHDDLAQLKDPRQIGFEIQQAKRVMAINFYAKVPTNSGQLKIWNIEPDDESRDKLNLTYSGFPYPAELLQEFSHIVIPVEAGDLCVINGNLVHAVLRGDINASPKNRLVITCFTTLTGQNEFIWWT